MNLLLERVFILILAGYASAHMRLLTDLNAVANTIRSLDDQPQKISQMLKDSLLPEPDCEDVKEFVPGRQQYRNPVLENFFAQRIPQLLKDKLPNDRVKIVIATTWKKMCGIGYYVRQMITTLEELMPGCTDIDIAELQKAGKLGDNREWPEKRVIGSAMANQNDALYNLGKKIADGNYDVILLENEHFQQELDQLNRFIDGIDYKGEGLARKRVLATIHTIWIDKNLVQKMKNISTRIAHFLQLFDYECLYFINLLGIDRERCVSINDAALGKGYRDRESLKAQLGLSGRKVIFNYGIMGDHKAPNTMAGGVADASSSYPDVLFLGVGLGAERYQGKYSGSQNVLFVGRQLSNEMIELLSSAADMFIMGNAEIPCTLFVSGTLTYGFNKGLPLISSELSYAQFIVRDEEVGYLAERYQSEPIKNAVISYFKKSEEERKEQYKQLYCKGKLVGWETIGKEYAALFTMIKLQENITQYKEKQVKLGKCDATFRSTLGLPPWVESNSSQIETDSDDILPNEQNVAQTVSAKNDSQKVQQQEEPANNISLTKQISMTENSSQKDDSQSDFIDSKLLNEQNVTKSDEHSLENRHLIIAVFAVLGVYLIIIWRLKVRLSKIEQRIQYQEQTEADQQDETQIEFRE